MENIMQFGRGDIQRRATCCRTTKKPMVMKRMRPAALGESALGQYTLWPRSGMSQVYIFSIISHQFIGLLLTQVRAKYEEGHLPLAGFFLGDLCIFEYFFEFFFCI